MKPQLVTQYLEEGNHLRAGMILGIFSNPYQITCIGKSASGEYVMSVQGLESGNRLRDRPANVAHSFKINAEEAENLIGRSFPDAQVWAESFPEFMANFAGFVKSISMLEEIRG